MTQCFLYSSPLLLLLRAQVLRAKLSEESKEKRYQHALSKRQHVQQVRATVTVVPPSESLSSCNFVSS